MCLKTILQKIPLTPASSQRIAAISSQRRRLLPRRLLAAPHPHLLGRRLRLAALRWSSRPLAAQLQIDIRVNNTVVRDQFLWDVSNLESDPEEFSRTLCEDLNIADPEVVVKLLKS